MRVSDIMTRKVEIVAMQEPAENAWNLMRQKRIHHLVVKNGGEIVGVLSERDLGGKDRETFRQTNKVLNAMTAYAVKATPEMPVRDAANLMRGWSIGCLPVLEDDKLVGIVTVSDLLSLLGRGAAKPPRWTLKRRAPRLARPSARKRVRAGAVR
jgi:acetoin utilization protein AcuB